MTAGNHANHHVTVAAYANATTSDPRQLRINRERYADALATHLRLYHDIRYPINAPVAVMEAAHTEDHP